jgi:hypothetical protein
VPPSLPRALAVVAGAGLLSAAAASSGAPPAAGPAGPSATAPPSVSGIAAAGNRLTGRSGTWAGTGRVAYSFRWYRCDAAGARCASIGGATAAGYRLAPRDTGKTIGLTVSATDDRGTAEARAALVGPIAPAAPPLESTAQPQVSGDAVVGRQLAVSTGTWSPTPSRLIYGWQRCNPQGRACTPIAGATRDSYTVAPGDVGSVLLAVVQALFGATTQTAFSTATAPAVAPDVTGPVEVLPPSVVGIQAVGARLQGRHGVWTGSGTLRYAYQWYRCDEAGGRCAAIGGATGRTHRLGARDVGKTIGLTVRATDVTGDTRAYASLVGPIAVARPAEEATAQPLITGDARVGVTLGVWNGVWSPAPTSTSYAWQRCNANARRCESIAGESGPTYVATGDDVGHRLVAVVTASAAGASHSALSVATAPVAG